MPAWWDRLMARRRDAAVSLELQEERAGPAERRLLEEGVEGGAADEVAEEHLGGADPERLIEDD